MPASMTMATCVARVLDACGLSDPAHISGGEITVSAGPLRRTLTIAKDKHDKTRFGWSVSNDWQPLSQRLDRFGGLGVEIWRPDHPRGTGAQAAHERYRYPWPRPGAALDERLVADLRRYVRPALDFVTDRADLGRLLLASDDVHRGPVWAHLPPGTAAGRLAKAVILARDAADPELEQAAFAVLREEGERDVTWVPGQPYLFRQAVADAARGYASVAGVPLDDLVRLKRKKVT